MQLRRVWLDAAVTEPVPCDPIFPSQPGSVDTVKILVSAGLGFRERTSCTELESSSAGPQDDGRSINHLLSLHWSCYSYADNQTTCLCTISAWLRRAWLLGVRPRNLCERLWIAKESNSVMLGSPQRAERAVQAELDASCHAVASTIAIGPGYASAVLLGSSYITSIRKLLRYRTGP